MEPQTPSTARMIDYWLGGKHHFPIDVAAAGAFEAAYRPCADIFGSVRAFSGRAVRHATAAGIDQFLVFGAGLPTRSNVHETAPGARVLYTDLDPLIVEAGRRILAGSEHTGYVHGDVTDLDSIDRADLDRVLPDWNSRPLGVVLFGLPAFFDDATLAATLDALYEAVPTGSRLLFDFDATELQDYPRALAMMGPSFHMREPTRFAALLGRWTPTPEGIVPVAHWLPDGRAEDVPDAFWGGVAVK
ncbi:SAM-dependent methyltransferase [Actinoplanes sp. NPDC049265]|uniref:SAM-dependent methyltransferase n=1 Tax=Actinoplanes sp. NPDC049265 TaxID=3363902 RepID=UPI0037155002